MSRAATSYPIGKPQGRCALSDTPINPEDPYIAALVDPPPDPAGTPKYPSADAQTQDLGIQRLDIALEAWNAGHRPEHLFAFWRTTMRTADDNRSILDAHNLLELFDNLEPDTPEQADDNPRRAAFRYILTLMLLRSRQLTQRGSRPATAHVPAALLVTRKGDPPEAAPIPVFEPTLDPATLADITQKLSTLIRH